MAVSWPWAAGDDVILCDLEPRGAERLLRMPIDRITALAFSPDGRSLAAASERHDEIIVWDLAADRVRISLRGHSSPVIGLAFTADGRSIVSGETADPLVLVWDLESGRPRRRLRLEVSRGPLNAIVCSTDGSRLATVNGWGEVRLWDGHSGRPDRFLERTSRPRAPSPSRPMAA